MKFEKLKKAQKVLVYGFGVEGRSSFAFLTKHFPHLLVEVYDDNLAINMPDFKKHPLEEYDVLIVSPGISRDRFSDDVRKHITSQAEIFFDNLPQECRQKVIGISGTKGKSTTTKFCAEFLKKNKKNVVAAGNYGLPFLDVFDDLLSGKLDFVVAELSSYQLEYLQTSPGIAIFLNVYPEHLDRHGDYQRYIEAKSHLWRFQKEHDPVIVPRKMKPLIQEQKPNHIFVSDLFPAEFFPKNSIFRAPHFLENFGTIEVLAELLDLPKETLQKTAHTFRGLPHRLEFVAKKKGILFYNDSISTNPHSTYSALRFLKEKVGTLILGGKDRGVDYNLLYQAISKFCPQARILVLQTETKDKLVQVFKRNGFTNYRVIPTIPLAVKEAFLSTRSGKICLLSPAASSFDTFQNYVERGNLFKKSVLEAK